MSFTDIPQDENHIIAGPRSNRRNFAPVFAVVAVVSLIVGLVLLWASGDSNTSHPVNTGQGGVNYGMPPAPNATGYQAGPMGAPHGSVVFTSQLSGPCQNSRVPANLRMQQLKFFALDPGGSYSRLVAQNGKYTVQLVWAANECAFRPLVNDGSKPTGGSVPSIDVSDTPDGPHFPSIAEVASHHYAIHFVWKGKVKDEPCSSFYAPLLGNNQVTLICAG